MDENPDNCHSPVSAAKEKLRAAIAWQMARFPQAAASFADDRAGFSVATDAWRCDGALVDEFLEYQDRFVAGMDDRTGGAHLIAFYSHHLAIAAGAIYLRTGLVPDLGPDSLSIRLEPAGVEDASPAAKPQASDARRFHFRFRRLLGHADGAGMFHDSFVASLGPAVETVKARTGLSPVAQWRLAADGIAGAFLDIGLASAQEERAMARALEIVGTAASPLSSSTLRYEKIAAVFDGNPVERIFRLRSGCCLYYRTDGGDFCDVCVLLDRATQKSRLRAHLEHTGGR